MRGLSAALALALCCWAGLAQAAMYGVALRAVPVLNSPAFDAVFGGRDGRSLKSDRCGQVRELEFIALPGTVFRILGEVKGSPAPVYRVETGDYPTPANRALYVESRQIGVHEEKPPPRSRNLPDRKRIVASLRAALGTPYVWGGNVQTGIPELVEMFYRDSAEKEKGRLTLAGLDCSGLLYQATGGWTPRNTSQLLSFGTPVTVTGKNAEEIARLLQPLDLIVWNGHVIIVLDRQTAIESRLECGKPGNGGVMTIPLLQRVREIMRTRRPADSWPGEGKQRGVFVVRRWFGL